MKEKQTRLAASALARSAELRLWRGLGSCESSQSSASAQSAQEANGASSDGFRLPPQGRTHAARVEPNNFPMQPETNLWVSGATLARYWSKGTSRVSRSVALHPEATNFILSASTPEGSLEVLESGAVLLFSEGCDSVFPVSRSVIS
jgi:hypothetical protein